jgi:hypothetical protein
VLVSAFRRDELSSTVRLPEQLLLFLRHRKESSRR